MLEVLSHNFPPILGKFWKSSPQTAVWNVMLESSTRQSNIQRSAQLYIYVRGTLLMCKEKSIMIIVGSYGGWGLGLSVSVSLNKENILKWFKENDTLLPVVVKYWVYSCQCFVLVWNCWLVSWSPGKDLASFSQTTQTARAKAARQTQIENWNVLQSGWTYHKNLV